ncbi:MAG TPA: hypothetical protein VK427_07295, partial [Kofleriaceae bacterium]|nr:hypothetical protein [Kofleriaceae bacterium]
LNDPATGAIGDVVVSRDNIEHTTSLNFSYLTPTANPEISMLVQGAGEIPNAAYTTTNTTARLVLPSTPFVVQRCAINTSTGDATCAPGPTVAWNLTWTQSGYSEIERFTLGREKVGPVTTRYAGWFREHSAIVNGTWNGNVAVDNAGFLRETMGSTVNIEVAVTLN